MKKSLLFLVMLTLLVGFSGCGNDDDEEDGYFHPDLYAWWEVRPGSGAKFPFYCTNYRFMEGNEIYPKNTVLIERAVWTDRYSSQSISDEFMVGTFRIKGNRIIIEAYRFDDDEKEIVHRKELEIVSLEGTTLVLKDGNVSTTYRKEDL